ncbi:MAG TPA: hypothetical protein VI916_09710 [Acidimicrobiia bacterium]|nr:hypothetical protein [Acidimicrobiia bacterium]
MHRVWRILILLLTVSLTPVSALSPPVRAASATCPTYTEVALVGSACRLPNGLWQVRIPGGGLMTTHGHDAPTHFFYQPPADNPVPPVCVADPTSEHHGQVIYARPVDRPDRFVALEGEIRDMVGHANAAIRAEASSFGSELDLRIACAETGEPDIDSVPLSTTTARTTFSTIVADLRALGYASPWAKYWIWVDFEYNAGGFGTIERDDSPTVGNNNNTGPSYAATYGTRLTDGGHHVMLHEAAHNLGAVQSTSPHTSAAWHCNDGSDLMCYADGGPRSNYSEVSCPTTMPFDCGHDDYFHPDPPAGSYLDTHWNLGSPLNRFTQGCLHERGALPSTLGAVDADEGVWIDVGPSCTDRRFTLTGRMAVIGGVLGYDKPDLDVCWYNATAAIRCDQAIGLEAGRIPAGTSRARVTLKAGFSTEFFIAAV